MAGKHRHAAKIDRNQPMLVKYLLMVPGVTVALKHDDIIVGYRGRNYWFEIKPPEEIDADGYPYPGRIKDSQITLLETWLGHYRVVWGLKQMFDDMGINRPDLLEKFAIESMR